MGRRRGEFDRLAAFLKSGIQAVRDTQPKTTPVMLHLADGGDTGAFTWWFDEITSRGVSFDLIGVSYYPYWHGSMNELQTNMNAISQRYGKEVIVVETAYGHTTANADTMPNAFGEAEAAAGDMNQHRQDKQSICWILPIGFRQYRIIAGRASSIGNLFGTTEM